MFKMSSTLLDDKAMHQSPETDYTHLSPTSNTDAPATTGTYLDEPTDIDLEDLTADEKKDVLAYASSSSYSSKTDTTARLSGEFTKTRTLLINARGIPVLRFPLPSNELEIAISTPQGELVYISTRERKRSGNATLSDANGKALIASNYLFGPTRYPKLLLLENEKKEEIHMRGRWISHRHNFTLPNGQELQWRYGRDIDPSASNTKGKMRSFLTLEAFGEQKKKTRRLAQLIRNAESRTPGSKSCSAGNGGELVIDGQALETLGVDEDIVVASCLVMLKKEIDRRRMRQIIVLTGAISGGS